MVQRLAPSEQDGAAREGAREAVSHVLEGFAAGSLAPSLPKMAAHGSAFDRGTPRRSAEEAMFDYLRRELGMRNVLKEML